MSDDLASWLRSQVDDDETLAESDYDIMISARKVRDAATEIARLRDVSDEVKGYLSRMLQTLHPSIDLLPTVLGVCTQIDHVLAGQREEIARLRAALATARMELEHAARQIDCQCGKRDLVLSELRELGSLHAENVCPRDRSCLAILAADIRAAAKEGEP